MKDFSRQGLGNFPRLILTRAVPRVVGFPSPRLGNARHGKARLRAAWHGNETWIAWQIVNGRRFGGSAGRSAADRNRDPIRDRVAIATRENRPRGRVFQSHCPLHRKRESRHHSFRSAAAVVRPEKESKIADAHRHNGRRFIVSADDALASINHENDHTRNCTDVFYRRTSKD